MKFRRDFVDHISCDKRELGIVFCIPIVHSAGANSLINLYLDTFALDQFHVVTRKRAVLAATCAPSPP